MMSLASRSAALALALACAAAHGAGAPPAMALQVLGSGGPVSDDALASSGAVVWIGGKSRLLIDAGGGTYLRFGQGRARLADLRFIGITHFHTDHSADLPALLKGAYFLETDSELVLAGPAASPRFPGMDGFFDALFGAPGGAFAYLSGLRDGSGGMRVTVHPLTVDHRAPEPVQVYRDQDVRVLALGIPHGAVPTLAYRIEGRAGTIVISADQNGSRPEFVDFARGADILVMPAAINDDAGAATKSLHIPPTRIGELAARIAPGMLVLNHFMTDSVGNKDANIAIIRKYYKGPVRASRDLSLYRIPAR